MVRWAKVLQQEASTAPVNLNSLLNGLSAYYRLDEVSGDRVDSIGSNNLVATPNTLGTRAGKIDNSPDFDGSSSLGAANPESSVYDIMQTDFTLSFWCEIADFSITSGLLSKFDGSNFATGSFYIALVPFSNFNPGIHFFVGDGGTNYDVDDTASFSYSALSTNTLHHLIFQHDKSSKSLTLYIDDSKVSTENYLSNNLVFTSAVPFTVGDVANDGSLNPVDGTVDELGIWTRNLSSDERSLLYNGGAGLDADKFRNDSGVSGGGSGGSTISISDATTTVSPVDNITISGGSIADNGNGNITLNIVGSGTMTAAEIKTALESLIDPDRLVGSAIANMRNITSAPIDDYCLTYSAVNDAIEYRPRIQLAGASAILLPLSQSLFAIADAALSTYTPDVGDFVFEDIKIISTAGTPDNQIVNEELVINTANTGAILNLGVNDTVLQIDYTFETGSVDAIILRAEDDGNMLFLEMSASGIVLKSVTSDAVTTIETQSFTFVDGTTYQIRVEVLGVEFNVLIDGSTIVDGATSNIHLTATKFGLGRIV